MVTQPDPDWLSAHRHSLSAILVYLLLVPTLIGLLIGWKSYWKEIILVSFSCLIGLGLGQIVVVVLYPELNLPSLAAVRERTYHHIYPPNEKFHLEFAERVDMIIETNSDGLRTDYEPEHFLDHDIRVAILGDSFVFGLGVESQQAVPTLLEEMLRGDLSLDAGVLNSGIISYSPFLESILFDGVVEKYRPTHTLLFLDATDFGDDMRYIDQATMEGGRIVFNDRAERPFSYSGFVVESFLGHILIDPLVKPWNSLFQSLGWVEDANPLALYQTEIVIDGRTNHNRFFHYTVPPEQSQPFFEQTYGHILKIADKANRIGSKFALVVTPRYHHWNDEECPDNWEKHQYGVDEPHEYEYLKFFEEKARDSPFPIFDLTPAFQETDRYPLVFPYDPHWNEAGHQFVAEKTLEFMKETYFDEE